MRVHVLLYLFRSPTNIDKRTTQLRLESTSSGSALQFVSDGSVCMSSHHCVQYQLPRVTDRHYVLESCPLPIFNY